MKKREFLKLLTLAGVSTTLSSYGFSFVEKRKRKLRTAHIGVGGMGFSDLKSISTHKAVEVTAFCDTDSKMLEKASKLFPKAKLFKDYRELFNKMSNRIDAVVVSTPDHMHAPVSLMAMEKGLSVYCQKPLAHFVSEVREMQKVAKNKPLITQMGIQVHSFYDYKLATTLIQKGIVGKVNTVVAWSNKNWGYDGSAPKGSDPVPKSLDWNLWQGVSPQRSYKEGYYHPSNWRKVLDYGCATLGDMGVHIFDTPYNALQLDVPLTVKNECRDPNGYGYPEENKVTYTFAQTPYTTEKLTWIWYDGTNALTRIKDFTLPNGDALPDQGAMFLGEQGALLLPHFMQLPKLIKDGQYKKIDIKKYDPKGILGSPTKDYDKESEKHYHEFVDACLGKKKTSAPFAYSGRLTEAILLGVVAGHFPNKELHWDRANAQFEEFEANALLESSYRVF